MIPSNRLDDLHHLEIAETADLVLFMAGNQFMAMKDIVSAFQAQYPEIKKIFYETLPLTKIFLPGKRSKIFKIYPFFKGSGNLSKTRFPTSHPIKRLLKARTALDPVQICSPMIWMYINQYIAFLRVGCSYDS